MTNAQETPKKDGQKGRIDAQILKPFVAGTRETLKVQCSVAATPGLPYAAGSRVTPSVDVVATIGLTSKTFNGSIALCFPKKTFLGVISGMLGEKYEEINSDLEDGAGELLNIIFGFAKRHLNDSGCDIAKAIPTVIRGNDVRVWHMRDTASGIIPFTTDVGEFYMEVAVKR